MKVLISEQLFQVCSAAFGIDAPRWNEKWVLHYYEDPEIVALRHGEVMVISLIHVTPAVLCTPSRTIQYTPRFSPPRFSFPCAFMHSHFQAYLLDTTTTSFLPPCITSPSYHLPSYSSLPKPYSRLPSSMPPTPLPKPQPPLPLKHHTPSYKVPNTTSQSDAQPAYPPSTPKSNPYSTQSPPSKIETPPIPLSRPFDGVLFPTDWLYLSLAGPHLRLPKAERRRRRVENFERRAETRNQRQDSLTRRDGGERGNLSLKNQ